MTETLKKILALDIGDQWVGSAISDASRMLARPYQTTTNDELVVFLQQVLAREPIEIIVVGYPKTMSGKVSEQTEKTQKIFDSLKIQFPETRFVFWDERLSSKRADMLQNKKTSKNSAAQKQEKIQSHSRAAAFILDSYLSYLIQQKYISEN